MKLTLHQKRRHTTLCTTRSTTKASATAIFTFIACARIASGFVPTPPTSLPHPISTPTFTPKSTSTSIYMSTESSSININPLLSNVKVSATVQIFSQVKQMQAEGIDVTSLCVGEPDFPPPQAILNAASRAILDCDTRYTAVTGTSPLREAIASDLKERKGISYNPVNEIVVGNGAKQCVYQGVLATSGVGDAVIIPAPYWPSYPEMVTLAQATSIILPTKEEDGYLINPQSLRECIEKNIEEDHNGDGTTNIKLLILCNPSNPTGGVHSKAQLEEIANVLDDYPQIAILADEIYERLVYKEGGSDDNGDDDDDHVSFASISDSMYQRTMTINGFSKAYAMTGMRLGYMAAPQHLAKAATTIQSQLTSCAGSISQAAGVAALQEVTEEEMERNVEIMREKRDYVIDQLKGMEGVNLAVPPTGAFYVLPDVSSFYDGDDTQLCLDLLKSKRLAIVPGTSFGAPGTVRISYATSLEELAVAMSKLKEFLEEAK
jgi:aspartate/methionine/tyrosine aminotransferase